MKHAFLLIALLITVSANKRSPDPQSSSTEACFSKMPFFEQFSGNLISNVSNPIFWLKFIGVILLIVLHLVGVFVCLKKRKQRNMIKNYMRVKQMMFSETLVENGIDRMRAYERPKTLHV